MTLPYTRTKACMMMYQTETQTASLDARRPARYPSRCFQPSPSDPLPFHVVQSHHLSDEILCSRNTANNKSACGMEQPGPVSDKTSDECAMLQFVGVGIMDQCLALLNFIARRITSRLYPAGPSPLAVVLTRCPLIIISEIDSLGWGYDCTIIRSSPSFPRLLTAANRSCFFFQPEANNVLHPTHNTTASSHHNPQTIDPANFLVISPDANGNLIKSLSACKECP
jgi:hypothetical protein